MPGRSQLSILLLACMMLSCKKTLSDNANNNNGVPDTYSNTWQLGSTIYNASQIGRSGKAVIAMDTSNNQVDLLFQPLPTTSGTYRITGIQEPGGVFVALYINQHFYFTTDTTKYAEVKILSGKIAITIPETRFYAGADTAVFKASLKEQ